MTLIQKSAEKTENLGHSMTCRLVKKPSLRASPYKNDHMKVITAQVTYLGSIASAKTTAVTASSRLL